MIAVRVGVIAALVLGAPGLVGANQMPAVAGCVILLHGLGRTSDSMEPLARAAESAGYSVANIDYPSREHPIEELAPRAIREGLARCRVAEAAPIHIVTHSLGGILVRYYAKRFTLPTPGRVVMLSPPNHGSEAADHLADWKPYRWLNGPAGQQLVTGPDGPEQLGPVDFPLGVITGNRHAFFDAWLADLIPGEDDGKVSLERAQVSGMRDFLVLPYSHPFIMKKPEVIRQALHFLDHGRFDRTQHTEPTDQCTPAVKLPTPGMSLVVTDRSLTGSDSTGSSVSFSAIQQGRLAAEADHPGRRSVVGHNRTVPYRSA